MQATLTHHKTNISGAPRRQPAFFVLCQAAVMLVIVLLSLELIFAYAGLGEQEFLRIDRSAGFAPMESKSVTWRKEGYSRLRFNSSGMQDVERSLVKPAGTYRIAVFGDSFVEALQVQRNENFCSQLERKLNQAYPKQHFEVLNFGVSNYNLCQELIRLNHKGFLFSPDLVLLAYRVDDTRRLAPPATRTFLTARPFGYVDQQGKLVIDYSVCKEWAHTAEARRLAATEWLRYHSRIWGVVGDLAERFSCWLAQCRNAQVAQANWWTTPNFDAGTTPQTSTAPTKEATLENPVVASNQVVETRCLWPIASGLLSEMNAECKDHQCRLVILRLPYGQGESDVEYKLLKGFTTEASIPLVDIGAFVRGRYPAEERAKLFIHGGHYSALGHAVVADRLVDAVAEAISDRNCTK